MYLDTPQHYYQYQARYQPAGRPHFSICLCRQPSELLIILKQRLVAYLYARCIITIAHLDE